MSGDETSLSNTVTTNPIHGKRKMDISLTSKGMYVE